MSGSKARALISSGLFFQKAALLFSKQSVCTSLSVCLSVNLLYFPGADRVGAQASLTAPRASGLTLLVFMETWQLSPPTPPFALHHIPMALFVCLGGWPGLGLGQVAMAISHSFQIELLKDVAFGPEIVQACSPAQQEELS